MRRQDGEGLASERAAARRTFVKRQARRLMRRHSELDRNAAEKAVERQIEGVLLPSVELDFVDQALAGTTVGDVLANPERYAREKLADPIEGREYDRDCAYINLRPDGSPWIYSFAHGEAIYALKFDAAAIEQAIETREGKQAAELFVKLMMLADDLDPIDVERLKNLTSKRSGIRPMALMASLKEAQSKAQRQRHQHDEGVPSLPEGITLNDFYAYLEMHNYIYTPTGKTWPAGSVDVRIPPVTLTNAGKPILRFKWQSKKMLASTWLDKNKAVEQMTWVPGAPIIIRDRYIVEGGWVVHPSGVCFNLYHPPEIALGNPQRSDHGLITSIMFTLTMRII